MEVLYNLIDQTLKNWGTGPWQHEPDRIWWTEPSGLKCAINRNPSLGQWCGYVGVPLGHPLFETGYEDIQGEMQVHGGLTYSGGLWFHDIDEDDDENPHENDMQSLQWFGFDCGHFMDTAPGMAHFFEALDPGAMVGKSYKTVHYAYHETTMLAVQIRNWVWDE